MKIKSISGFNFAGYSSIQVNLDEHSTYFIGRNGSGKTKLGLELVWFVMQGIAEKCTNGAMPLIGERFRFIGDAGKTAMGEIVLYDENRGHEIRVIRKLTKTGTELSFNAPVGMELDQQWLNQLFNIFLISPKKFIDLSSKEQAIALGIDTSSYDIKIAALKEKYTDLNRDLKKYSNLLPVEKVERIDAEALQAQMKELQQDYANQFHANKELNKKTREAWETAKKQVDEDVKAHNADVDKAAHDYVECRQSRNILKSYGFDNEAMENFVLQMEQKVGKEKTAADYYPAEPVDLSLKPADYIPAEGETVYINEMPDQTAIVDLQEKILKASQTNEAALLYEQYQQKLEDKESLEKQLQDNKVSQNDLEAQKVEYIKAFKFPFDSLSVDEDGGLLLKGKPLKPHYFSSGELIRIVPTLISSLNPEFKYVFIQEFDLLDEETQVKVEEELTAKGFQLVIELVGKEKLPEKNCILLRNSSQVSQYPQPIIKQEPTAIADAAQ